VQYIENSDIDHVVHLKTLEFFIRTHENVHNMYVPRQDGLNWHERKIAVEVGANYDLLSFGYLVRSCINYNNILSFHGMKGRRFYKLLEELERMSVTSAFVCRN
jgi:hypothetical protein